ncbi:protein-lysine N-methyltransferase SMYD4-like [Oratosquilla oratoria]|uniref:protein-lysine N-methyltransferase SMYD4-like n=1 Tax=Oratosquilla oratoria TaxID=337810 RepID=UPI003F766CDE
MGTFSCQPLLDRLTHVFVKGNLLSEFAKQNSTFSRIKFCLENEVQYDSDVRVNSRKEIQQLLDVLYGESEAHGKSEALALKEKEKGSKAYMKKRDKEAYDHYSKCIRLAPPTSSILCLAFANRSAVLFHMGKYEHCLQDIRHAEMFGYPSSLHHKILTRKLSCYINLKDVEKASEVLKMCQESTANVPKESQESYSQTLKGLKEKFLEMKSSSKKSDPVIDCSEDNSLYNGENKTVLGMTSSLDVSLNETYGRHVVTTAKVPKGSVVFKESPYAAILLPEYHLSHCQNCFKSIESFVPCEACSDIVYCNEKCREEGRSFHKYECKLIHILSAVGIAHLALRVVLVTGWDILAETINSNFKVKVPGTNRAGVYNGPTRRDGYTSVYHLMTHLDKALPEDQLQYSFAAILLSLVLLDRTEFFENTMGKDCKKPELLVVASAVMHHIAQLVSNAHAITQLLTSNNDGENKTDQITQTRIATAIYPTASLMNHSCAPTIINSFQGGLLLIRCIKDLAVGEQVFNCYGPHYCRQSREDRSLSLRSQYFFECQCGPCTDPEFLLSEAAWAGLKCEFCRGVAVWRDGEEECLESSGKMMCLKCHKLYRPSGNLVAKCSKVNSLYEKGCDAVSAGNIEEGLRLLKEAVAIGTRIYCPENHFLNQARDLLAQAYCCTGDYMESCRELKESLQVIEKRYGTYSVELGHELQKYSDVLSMECHNEDWTRRREIEELKKRINEIFTINYGTRWNRYIQRSRHPQS